MPTSLMVYTTLAVWAISLALIYFVLMKIDRRIGGLAIVFMGVYISTLDNLFVDIGDYIFAPVWITVIIGLYVTFHALAHPKKGGRT